MNTSNNSTEIEIDVFRILKALFQRLWIILIFTVVFGVVAFSYAAFALEPTYDAEALLYVNNSSFQLGNSSVKISSSDISAAQSLVDTYIVILNTRLTLEEVAEDCELDYSYKDIKGMLTAEAVSGTEIFRVRVRTNNPEHSKIIANTIAKVLPEKISEVVDGSSVRIVDYAVKPAVKSGPDITKITVIGMALGILISCAGIIIWELTDTIIHDEDYLTKTFPKIPILAVIPNLNSDESSSSYKYYYYYSNSNKSKKKGE